MLLSSSFIVKSNRIIHGRPPNYAGEYNASKPQHVVVFLLVYVANHPRETIRE
jgi:hypothetical protein